MRKLQILITTYYLQISWHDINLRLTLGMQFDKLSWPMTWSTWTRDFFSKSCILVCKLYTVLPQNLLRPNVNFIADVKVDISIKKLHTRYYFWEESRDHIHEVIYRLHLSRSILNLSLQLTLCRETCVLYV